MFDKFKNAVGESTLKAAADRVAPIIKEKLGELDLNPSEIADDEKYKTYVVGPMLLAVKAGTSGLTGLIADFDKRFLVAMLHLRDELLVIDPANKKVSLVPDYEARLPAALAEGLRKPG